MLKTEGNALVCILFFWRYIKTCSIAYYCLLAEKGINRPAKEEF
jgi:hypothetical protein